MQASPLSLVSKSLVGCVAACAFGAISLADTVTIEPAADTSLIQNSDNANGGSTGIFAGQTTTFGARRALMKFDIAGAVPAGSTVTRAVLQLTVAQTTSDASNFSLHRVNDAWNEGTANGSGGGAPANDGDATWVYRVYNSVSGLAVSWTNPGGDYVGGASGSALVAFGGAYTWGSTAGMVADVQAWLDTPGSNNGWLLKATSEVIVPSAKRFYSREYAVDVSQRPKLTIEYTTGAPTCNDIDFNNDSSFFDPQDIDAFLSVYSEGPCVPETATCDGIDFNNDGSLFDPCDIDAFLLVFSEGPCTLCGV